MRGMLHPDCSDYQFLSRPPHSRQDGGVVFSASATSLGLEVSSEQAPLEGFAAVLPLNSARKDPARSLASPGQEGFRQLPLGLTLQPLSLLKKVIKLVSLVV